MIFTGHVGTVMIFTGSRNAAASDNSMYCMIPDPFPSTAFGKGSATPDYPPPWLYLVAAGLATAIMKALPAEQLQGAAVI